MSSENTTSFKEIFKSENDIPEEYKVQEIHQRVYLLNGELVEWKGDVTEIHSPVCIRTENGLERKLLGSIPNIGVGEAMDVLDASVKAYNNGLGEWPTMSVEGRIKCMQKFVYLMIKERDLIIKLLMWEIGKTLPDSTKEFDRTVDYINQTIDALKDLDRESSRFQQAEGTIAQIRRAPLGVVLSMGPFNYPLNEIFTTLIPALIMGNTIIFKLPKHGVLAHYPLLNAFKESFPKGTVNTLYGKGSEIITPIMESGKVNVLAFIGSSKVANGLKKLHPKVNRLRAILSLDAKNAAIVTKNANLDIAVSEIILGALSFNGQRCTALKLIFIQKEVAEEFTAKLTKAVSELKPGLPWEKDVKITPLPEANKPAYLKECIEDALSKEEKYLMKTVGIMRNHSFFLLWFTR